MGLDKIYEFRVKNTGNQAIFWTFRTFSMFFLNLSRAQTFRKNADLSRTCSDKWGYGQRVFC